MESEKKKRYDALFGRGSDSTQLPKERRLHLERMRDRADRLLENRDFVEFLTDLELDFGGLNYGTEEVDVFTQGRLSFFNDIKSRLYISEKAPKIFAEMTRRFIQPMSDDFQELLSEETKKGDQDE